MSLSLIIEKFNIYLGNVWKCVVMCNSSLSRTTHRITSVNDIFHIQEEKMPPKPRLKEDKITWLIAGKVRFDKLILHRSKLNSI